MRWTKVLAGLGIAMLAEAQAPATATDLFQTTKIWNVHLTFTADQWSAIEPKTPPGVRPVRRGPVEMLFTAFMNGDTDGDGRLSRAEFQSLAEHWFAERNEGAASTFRFGPPRGGPGLVGPQGGRNGMSAVAGIQFEYVHANLDFEGRELRDVAVRYKGNNTWMMARDSLKKSFKIDLNKYVKGQKLGRIATLNLHNNIADPSGMNEALSYWLFRDAGVPSPRTSYARVFVTVPGTYDKKYFGLYSIVENIDEDFAADRFGTDEGAIYKPVTRELFSHISDDWSAYKQMYDPKTKLTRAQKDRVIEFAQFVTSASDADFSAKAGEYLDFDQFARFMAVTVWLSNQDSILGMGQNFYVYLNAKTNRFQFLPWDLDHSFGQFPMAGGQSETLSIHQPWQGRNNFLERVFSIAAFRKLYLAKLAEFNTSIFDAKRIAREADRIGATIGPAVAEESSSRRDAAPRKPVKTFVVARSQSVADQLAGKQTAAPVALRGPQGFDPLNSLWSSLDSNGDSRFSRAEFTNGFAAWFQAWDANEDAHLSAEELRQGLSTLMPRPPMPPGARPF